jgi:hypothetical protein
MTMKSSQSENLAEGIEKKHIFAIHVVRLLCFAGNADVVSKFVRFVWKKTCGD